MLNFNSVSFCTAYIIFTFRTRTRARVRLRVRFMFMVTYPLVAIWRYQLFNYLLSDRRSDTNQWCCPQDQGLGLEAPRGQKWKSWSWSGLWNIWSWSWRKSFAVFQDFCCNTWRQWARHTMAFCERQQKQFAIQKPLFERTFCAPCTSASVERVFNNGE